MKYSTIANQDYLEDDTVEVQGEEEIKEKAGCCTWTIIRRAFRIVFLVLVLVAIIAIPTVYISYQYTYLTKWVSTDKPLKVRMKNCKLYIAEEYKLSKTEIELEIDIPGSDYSLGTGAYHELVARSSITYVDACVVDMRIHPEAVLQGLEVICEGHCRVSHYGSSALNLGSGSLTLTGDTIKFMSPKTKAGRVYANMVKGNVHLYNVELPAGSSHSLTTGEGDIVVQSLNSMRLDWTQDLNNICFYAPTVLDLGSAKSDCGVSKNGGQTASGCATSYMLCKSGDACSGSLSVPVISARTGIGNIYANVISGDGAPVSESGGSVRGFNYTYGPNINSYMNKTIESLTETLRDSSKADPLIWIALGNQEVFVTAGQTFLLVANAAYLHAYPWWISFFSANLLLGKVYKLDGNFAPGFCPFYTLPTTSRLAAAKSLVLSRLDILSNKADAAFVYGPSFPQPKTSPTNCNGFRGTEGILQLYNIVFEDENYRLQEYGLTQNVSLIMAVIIGLMLAVLIGIFGLYVGLLALDALLTHFLGQYKHISAYSQRLENQNVTEDSGVRPSQVADMNDIQEKLEGEEKRGLISSVFQRLPSQFMLIDILVRELKNWMTSSVEVFYDVVFESLGANEVDDFMPIVFRDIKIVYEQFCFLKQITEEDLLNDTNLGRLKGRGFVFERTGRTVELLKKVRWITDDEELELQRNPITHPSTASSLDVFILHKCVTTNFSSDCIEFETFLRIYEEYCLDKRLEMMVVTRAQLHDSYGIESSNESPYYLRRSQDSLSGSGKNKFNLEKVRRVNHEMVRLNAGTSHSGEQSEEGTDPSVQIAGVRMFIFDMISVFLHLIALFVLSAFVVIIPLFVELEISYYSLSDYRYKFRYEDLTYAPWNIPMKMMYVSTATVIALIFAGLYILIGILDLIIYYRYKTFPTESLKNIQKMKINVVSRILQYFIWFYICVLITMIFMYFALVAVWAVLGAIMNPNAYLAYGAAAMTFVSFVGAKIQQFQTLHSVGFQALQDMLFSKLQGMLDEIMKKILAQAGFAVELMGKGKDLQSGLMERAERVIRGTPVGKAIAALGLDPKNVIAGLQGDEEALIEIGCKQGVPRDVMVLLMAMIKGRRRELIVGLQKFASTPAFQLDPNIIDFAVEVVLNRSELNVPVLINRASQIFFTIAYDQIKSSMGDAVDQEKMDYLDICRQVFPRLVSAFKHFRTEEMDVFLEFYEEINDFLFNSVKKRAIALTTSQKRVFSKLFNEKGEPIFALPSYILKGIRIFNLIALGEEVKPEKATINRVLSAIYYILENFLGADPRITNMLNLILSPSREMISAPNLNAGLLPIEEQEKVLMEICEILKLPPCLFSMAWKIFTGNYVIDDEFVSNMSSFLQTQLKMDMPEQALKLILHLFSVMYSSICKGSLMSDAKKFGVEDPLANVVYLFGKNKIPTTQFGPMMQNSVFQGIISKLRISPSDAFGIISLLKGDFSNPSLLALFDSLKKRWDLMCIPSEVFVALTALFLSSDENVLILAVKRLRLFPYEFILIARKLLHPGNVSIKIFEAVGIRKDNPYVANRLHIPTDDELMLKEWRESIIKLLAADYRAVKDESEQQDAAGPTPPPAARGEAATKKEDKEEDKDETEMHKSEEEEEKSKRKEELDEAFEDLFEKPKVETFTEEEKRMRSNARLLLGIADHQITESNLREIMDKVPMPYKVEHRKIDLMCEYLNILLHALKDLRDWISANKVRNAIHLIADLVQINQQPLTALVSLIYLQEKESLMANLAFLVKGILTKHESEEIVEYCTYLLDKSRVLRKAEESIQYIATELRIPKFVIKMILSPLRDQDPNDILMDECLTLLDHVGLNQEALAVSQIAFKWPTSYPMIVNEFRINLAGVIMGHSSTLMNMLGMLGFPKQVMHLVKAITAGNKIEIFRSIHMALYPILQKFGISQQNFYIIIEIFKLFNGMGDQPALDPKSSENGYEYLKKTVGIVPEFLYCIEASVQQHESKLVECLPKLFKAINELDLMEESMKITPDIVSGMLTLLSGDNRSLENMAEKMRVNQEFVELCVKLMSINKGKESEIPKRLQNFQQSPLIAKVWTALGVPSEVVDSIMALSFGAFKYDDLNEILQKLNIKQHTEPIFLNFLMSVIRSWATIQSISDEPMYQDSEHRILPLEDLRTYMKPLAKRLMINPELVLIGLRIRQGDFFIIEEHSNFLNFLLPNKNMRKLAMGMCGMFTLSPGFKRKYRDYPDDFEHTVSFESAAEILCELFNINPVVPRLMMMDEATLAMIESEYGVSRKAITWFIVTLINLPIFVLEAIALREFKKLVFLKLRHCEEILQNMEAEDEIMKKKTMEAMENKKSEELKKEELKKEELKKQELKKEEKATLSPEGSLKGSEAGSHHEDQSNESIGNDESEEKKEEKKEEEEKKEKTAEELAEERGLKVKKLLNVMRASMATKSKMATSTHIFDQINFDNPEYDNLLKDISKEATMKSDNEMFECLMFNNEKFTKMNYDYITSKERREGVFTVSDERVVEIFGTKEEYYKDMANTFYVNPNDPSIWLNKETLDLSKTWCKKEDRGVRKNVWGELKNLFVKLSMDPTLTNKAKHKYDRITLSQMTLFMLMIRIKRRMNSRYELKKDERFYSLYCLEMECLGLLVEGMSFTKGMFGKGYSRMRLFKVLSLALNSNIANMIDFKILPSFYSKSLFYEIKEQYESREELQNVIEFCKSLDRKMNETDIQFIDYRNFNELEAYLKAPNDIMDAENVARDTSPYFYEKYGETRETFDYEVPKDDIFMQGLSEADIMKRKKACVKPMELTKKEIGAALEDPVCRQPYADVVKMMGSIEAYFVVEQEKLDFFLDIARGQWNAFNNIKKLLTAAGYLKNENTHLVYKALTDILCLRKNIKDWKVNPVLRKIPFSTTAIGNLFSFLLKRVNEGLIDDIVMLSHGVLNYSTIKDLSAKYGLDFTLTQSFFLAGYTEDIFDDKEKLEETLNGLLERLKLENRRELILTLVDVFKGRRYGWEEMAKHCCFGKPNALMILKCIIQMMPWDGQHPSTTSGTINPSNMYHYASKDLPVFLTDVMSFLVENETGVQKKIDDPKVRSVLWLCNGIIRQDLDEVLYHVSCLKEDIGLGESNSYELIRSFIVLMSNHTISDPTQRAELIRSTTEVLGDWMVSLLEFKDEGKKAEYRTRLQKLVLVVLGGMYRDWEMLKEGLNGINPMIGEVTKMWNYISNVIKTLSDQKVPLKRLKQRSIEGLLKAFMGLVQIAKKMSQAKQKAVSAIKEKTSKIRTLALPIEHYAEFRKKVGKSYDCLSFFSQEIVSSTAGLVEALAETPIELCEAYEVEVEKKDYLSDAVAALRAQKHDFRQYEFFVLFLVRDVDYLLSFLESSKVLSPDIVSTFKMVDHIFQLDNKEFRNLINNPDGFKKYADDLAKFFISPLANYVKSFIEQKLKGTLSPFEAEMYKRAMGMTSNVSLLSQMVMLLHYIRYGSIRKQSVRAIMKTIFEALKGSLSGVLQEHFPKLILALSGFEDVERSKAVISFDERRGVFTRMFIQMCIPDLVPRLDLIEKLLHFGSFLLKIGGNPELIWESREDIIDLIGSLMGVNPQVIRGVFGILKGDFQALVDYVAPVVRISPKIISTISKVFQTSQTSLSYVMQDSGSTEKVIDDVERSNWLSLMKKVNDGQASVRELFQLVDMEGDKSGGISVEEFANLMKKIGMSMTSHRITEIFARCKPKSSPQQNELNIQEFEEAIKYVQSKRVYEGLHLLGISTNQLIFLFTILAIILILLFVFIFLGIDAFSLGGTFGSIINSVLPCGAGFAVGKRSPINPQDLDWVKKLKETAEEVIQMVGGDL